MFTHIYKLSKMLNEFSNQIEEQKEKKAQRSDSNLVKFDFVLLIPLRIREEQVHQSMYKQWHSDR